MLKTYDECLKKDEKIIPISKIKSEQNQKNKITEKESNVTTYFPQSQTMLHNNNIHIKKPKLSVNLYIGNEVINKSLLNDNLQLERVKKHLDQEYLDKYRKSYIFNPSPPRPEFEISNRKLNMAISISQFCHETSKKSPTKNIKKESHRNIQINKETSKNKETCSEKIKKSDIDDNLPIALRKSKRPTTKPLRFWLGEQIIYKFDQETGCYTKAFEVTVNDNENSTEKQELIVKKNTIKALVAKEKGKNIQIKNGKVFITINDKKYKASSGCSIYLPQGQKIIFDNQSDDNATIFII